MKKSLLAILASLVVGNGIYALPIRPYRTDLVHLLSFVSGKLGKGIKHWDYAPVLYALDQALNLQSMQEEEDREISATTVPGALAMWCYRRETLKFLEHYVHRMGGPRYISLGEIADARNNICLLRQEMEKINAEGGFDPQDKIDPEKANHNVEKFSRRLTQIEWENRSDQERQGSFNKDRDPF